MKKTTVVALVFFCVAFMTRGAVFAQESDWSSRSNFFSSIGIKNADLDKIKEIIDTRMSPIVKSVALSPEKPGDNEPVSVTAVIITPDKPNGEEVYEAYVNYSIDDGQTFQAVEMDRSSDRGDTWTGTIPGQPSGTNVIYGIQAVNAFDETYVETLCETDSGKQDIIKYAAENCKDVKIAGFCDAKKPIGCLFPMSISSDKFDSVLEDKSKIPAGLYITSTRTGFNENELFLDINAKGDISGGTYSPTDIYVYVAGWLNSDKLTSKTGIDAILEQGAIILYAPLNYTNKCALYSMRGTDPVADIQSVKCEPHGNQLTLSINRKAIGDNSSRTLDFIFMTFEMTRITPVDVDLKDITLFTKSVYKERSFQVD